MPLKLLAYLKKESLKKWLKRIFLPSVQQILIGMTDAEAEIPIFWPPDMKSQLTTKYPDAGEDWGQEENGVTEHEMVEWHHQLNGREFEQAPRDGKW